MNPESIEIVNVVIQYFEFLNGIKALEEVGCRSLDGIRSVEIRYKITERWKAKDKKAKDGLISRAKQLSALGITSQTVQEWSKK